jgi:hypothetical protein
MKQLVADEEKKRGRAERHRKRGPRHRKFAFREDIHIKFPDGSYEIAVDIANVKPGGVAPKKRHHRR